MASRIPSRPGRCLFLLVAACALAAGWAQEIPSKILFLQLRMETNRVSMIKASAVPGTLKRLPGRQPAIDLELATAAGQILWTNSVADPSLRHLEYEDPDHPGTLTSKEVRLTNVEFTVRVPLFASAHHVSFYRPQASARTNTPSGNPSDFRTADPRTLLGVVTLPEEVR